MTHHCHAHLIGLCVISNSRIKTQQGLISISIISNISLGLQLFKQWSAEVQLNARNVLISGYKIGRSHIFAHRIQVYRNMISRLHRLMAALVDVKHYSIHICLHGRNTSLIRMVLLAVNGHHCKPGQVFQQSG